MFGRRKPFELPTSAEGMMKVTLGEILAAMKAHDAPVWNFVDTMPDGQLLSVAIGTGRQAEVLAESVQARMNVTKHVPNTR